MYPKKDNEEETNEGQSGDRPFVSILFKCCNVYQRIYLNRYGKAFVGWCPKCCRRVTVKVDPSGSDDRFFTAG
jgi:hypothetical protein